MTSRTLDGSSRAKPRQVELGTAKVTFPSSYLQELEDSSEVMDDTEALKARLHHHGYLFLRGFHRREDVLAARLAVLDHIRQSGPEKLDSGQPWEAGVLDRRCGRGCIPSMEGKNSITHHEAVMRVLEGERPRAFFQRLFGEEELTLDYKWLRGIHKTAYTGVHVDWVYMGRGTERLLTMWTPLDDVPVEMGTLAMCEHSHRLDSFNKLQETYGSSDIEKLGLEGSGWFTRDPLEITQQFGGQWRTADFHPGDVIIFTMRTVHMSTANLTEKVRISCDTRWQPKSEPVDTRYMGEINLKKKYGFYGEGQKPRESLSMAQLKENWGFSNATDNTI